MLAYCQGILALLGLAGAGAGLYYAQQNGYLDSVLGAPTPAPTKVVFAIPSVFELLLEKNAVVIAITIRALRWIQAGCELICGKSEHVLWQFPPTAGMFPAAADGEGGLRSGAAGDCRHSG